MEDGICYVTQLLCLRPRPRSSIFDLVHTAKASMNVTRTCSAQSVQAREHVPARLYRPYIHAATRLPAAEMIRLLHRQSFELTSVFWPQRKKNDDCALWQVVSRARGGTSKSPKVRPKIQPPPKQKR